MKNSTETLDLLLLTTLSIINIILGDAALCKVAPEGLKNLGEQKLFGFSFTLYTLVLLYCI